MPSKRSFKKNRPTAGYKSKTQVIAHNEARRVYKANISRTIEKKRWDGQQGYTNCDIVGTITGLYTDPVGGTQLGSGTGAQGTVGDTITPTKVLIRYAISIPAVAANGVARVVVLQSRGTWSVPAWTDFIQSTTDETISNFNQSTVQGKGGRFRILYDRRITVTTASAPQLHSLTIRIPKKKLIKTKFSAGTPIQISDGNLWIAYIGDNAVNAPQIKYYSSVYYTDA